MKEHLEIEIPAPTEGTGIQAFLNQKGEHGYAHISNVIFDLIEKILSEQGVQIPLTLQHIQEIIKNSYDAFARGMLHSGKPLILTLTVSEKNEPVQIHITIQDNATGFPQYPPGETFFLPRKPIYRLRDKASKEKSSGQFLGGCGVGLQTVISDLESDDIAVKFNNSIEGGASTIIFFEKETHKKGRRQDPGCIIS